ncbi:unnamed protein product [Mucor fragilis]
MLRPIQFEQDVARRIYGDLPVKYYQDQPPTLKGIAVPLKQIHEYQESVPFKSLRKWKEAMGEREPYHLTKERLTESCNTSCAEISCIVCFVKMDVSWEDFAEWRLDHTIALACHRCSGMFTIKHVGKANLLNDIGNQDYCNNLARYFKLPLDSLRAMKRLPFNSGLNQVESYMPSDKYTKDQQREFMDLVQSTYLCHPYKGSFDLIYAVARQYKFAYKITKLVPWKIPNDIYNAMDEYNEFLDLVKLNQDLVAVPTIKADLIWHLHMLNPLVYHMETSSIVGRVLNHDDTIPEKELKQYANDTQTRLKILRQENAKKNVFLNVLNSKKREDEAKLREESKGIKDLLTFNNSEKAMEETFGHLMYTEEGFSGTSACGNTEYLNRWKKQEQPVPKEKEAYKQNTRFETYSKVFRSTGKSPHIPPEVLAKISYDNTNVDVSLLADYDAMQSNTTEEPFDWEKVSLAWADIFGRTADVKDVRHFHTVQQGGIGASCGVISLRYIAPWKHLQLKRKLPQNSTASLRNRGRGGGGGGGGGGDFGYGAFGSGADAGFGADTGFGDAGGSSSNGGGFGDGGGGSSGGAGDGGGSGGGDGGGGGM